MRFLVGHRRTRVITESDYQETYTGYKTACWIWVHCAGNEMGHGKVTVDGRKTWAHIAHWRQVNGDVPAGLELDHLCRTPSCIRPDHLDPVTHGENLRRGAGTRMTQKIRGEILRLGEEGLSHRRIASLVGMGRSTVGDVLNRKRWHEHQPPTGRA